DDGDLRRQREHDVEVWHLQQLGLARLQPLPRLRSLALWAVAVAAGVVGDDGVPARFVLTARNMAAKGRRAAALDRAHHLELAEIRSHNHVLTPGCYVGAADVEDDDVCC